MKAEDSDGHDFEDPYAVLGVSRDCKQRDLRKKYQQLAREVNRSKYMPFWTTLEILHSPESINVPTAVNVCLH